MATGRFVTDFGAHATALGAAAVPVVTDGASVHPCIHVQDSQARLEGWTVSVAQAQALGLALAGDVNLTTLVLRRAGLHRASLAALLSALARAPALATIHIDANVVPVGEQPIDDLLGELVMVPPQLQSLAVTSSGVTDAGASAIAAALGNSPPLVYLNLWNNAIAAPGASSLAKALRFNRMLKGLSLGHNARVADAGALAFASVLGRFALTHEETVQRRRLLSGGEPGAALDGEGLASTQRGRVSVAVKKPPAKKDATPAGAAPAPAGKKGAAKDKAGTVADAVTRPDHPLMAAFEHDASGNLVCPGNDALMTLNLTHCGLGPAGCLALVSAAAAAATAAATTTTSTTTTKRRLLLAQGNIALPQPRLVELLPPNGMLITDLA